MNNVNVDPVMSDIVAKRFGESFKLFREASSLSLADIVVECDIALPVLALFEAGQALPSSSQLIRLAELFETTPGQLLSARVGRVCSAIIHETPELPSKYAPRILQEVETHYAMCRQIECFIANDEHKFPDYEPPRLAGLPVEHSSDVEEVAYELRQAWSLTTAPIDDLMGEIESRGVLMVPSTCFGLLDATSGYVEKTPYIVFNRELSALYQRVGIARELSRLLLIGNIAENLHLGLMSARLASALLLPEDALVSRFGPACDSVDDPGGSGLSSLFGLPVTLVRSRLKECGIESRPQDDAACTELSNSDDNALGLGRLWPERTVLRLVKDDQIGISKGAELLGMRIADFRKLVRK